MLLRLIIFGIVFSSFISPGRFLWANEILPFDLHNKTPRYLIKKGKSIFLKYCAHCHGIFGDGDGFNAEFLEKEPAELSDEKFISRKTNKQIFKIIKLGGKAVRKSHLMPVFGNTLSEAEIWSLVAYIRDLAGDEIHPVKLTEGWQTKRPVEPPVSSESIDYFSKWFRSKGGKEQAIEQGGRLFKKKRSCIACHQLNGEGGKLGPDLSRSAFTYKPEWIYGWIKNPQVYKPETIMPQLGIGEEDAELITAFLMTFREDEKTFSKEWEPYLSVAGDPDRGKAMFFDPEGKVYCSKCHQVNGKGGRIGPDLSFVGTSRTRRFLLESILEPSKVITSGFSTVLILTKDRKFITGVKIIEDDSGLDIIDKEGKEMYILKEEIKKFKNQKISMMPGNFIDLLDEQEVADILAYLTTLSLPEYSKKADGQNIAVKETWKNTTQTQ